MRVLLAFAGLWLGLATGAMGETYLVTPHGTGDFPTIQAAINHALDGDIIELTNGVFRGAGNWDIDYLGKEITVRSCSGDPRACIVDGEANHYGFRFEDVGARAVLEGITVRNCWRGYGGAIQCVGSSFPLIAHCVFRRNEGYYGGAIYCDIGAAPTISLCTLIENTAVQGGGLCM